MGVGKPAYTSSKPCASDSRLSGDTIASGEEANRRALAPNSVSVVRRIGHVGGLQWNPNLRTKLQPNCTQKMELWKPHDSLSWCGTLTGYTKSMHMHQHGRRRSKTVKNHCLSTGMHSTQRDDIFIPSPCRAHVGRQGVCHHGRADFVISSLHFMRPANFTSVYGVMLSLRNSTSVAATRVSSIQESSQNGETPNQGNPVMHKTAMLSVKGVKVVGLEAEMATASENMKLEHKFTSDQGITRLTGSDVTSGQGGSGTIGVRSLKQKIGGKMSDFNNFWKAIHEVYREDTATWGFGSSPIFTVYEGVGGKIEKVTIDEKEIQRRQGIEPLLPGYGDEASKARAQKMIMLARTIAKDLEMGNTVPKINSTIFAVIKHASKDESKPGHQKLFNQVNSVAYTVAPALKSVFLIAMPIYGICIIWGAYLLITKQSDKDIIKEEKAADILDKMRKLKTQMNAHKGDIGASQSPLAPSDFMKRLLEVREMARQVRSEEELQKSTQDSDTGLEYQSRAQNLIGNLAVEADFEMEQAEIEIVGDISVDSTIKEDLDTLQVNVCHNGTIEGQGPEQEDMSSSAAKELKDTNIMFAKSSVEVTRSAHESSALDGALKPAFKVKPRIIMSLEEAKATISGKNERLSDATGSNPDFNITAERTTYRMEHQVGQEFTSASILHDDDSYGRLNLLGGFCEDMSPGSGSEVLQSRGDRTLAANNEKQDRGGGKQKELESLEGEEPKSDTLGELGMMCVKTLGKVTSQGREKEEARPESIYSRGPDGLKDPNKAATSHLLNKIIEDRQQDEAQISSLTSTRHGNHYASSSSRSPYSDKISDEGLRSSHSGSILVKNATKKAGLSANTKDVVGSGQPLREEGIFTNTKRWSKELQRRYDSERDPEVRELMKEIGSELDSWVTEEEVEEAGRLASKIEGGDEDYLHKHYQKVQKKIKEERERFGLETVLEKYKEYQPKLEDELWWLDLRFVLCLMVVSRKRGRGLYGLDMTLDLESASNQVAKHIVAFEERKDALNFCRTLQHSSGSRFQHAEVCPFSPKQLYKIAKEEGFKVTVLRMGQIQANVDQTLEEVEEKILEIGRSVYWEKLERERSIDIDSILHQRFGL